MVAGSTTIRAALRLVVLWGATGGWLAGCGAEPSSSGAPHAPSAPRIEASSRASAVVSASSGPSSAARAPEPSGPSPSDPSAAGSAPDPGPSGVAADGAEAPALPSLPKGTVVLQVGDSMADALGKDLGRELEARGVRSILKAKEATYIPEWAGFSMGLKNLLIIHKPDLVIITLGGNEVAMRDPSVRAEPVRKIVEAIGDRPCVWVGAPLWGPHTGILDVIRSNCSPCRFVDTNALVPNLERLKDGVHPTLPERKRWAKAMVEWLALNRDPAGTRPWDLKR